MKRHNCLLSMLPLELSVTPEAAKIFMFLCAMKLTLIHVILFYFFKADSSCAGKRVLSSVACDVHGSHLATVCKSHTDMSCRKTLCVLVIGQTCRHPTDQQGSLVH